MALPNRSGAEATVAPTQDPAATTSDLGSASFSNSSTALAESHSLSNQAVLEEGALVSSPDLIDATRQEQSVNGKHHHEHTLSEAFTEEHRALQRAGFEGPLGGMQSSILSSASPVAGTQASQAASAQLHDHILSLSLSGSKKKKEAITDDAELAEFVRQHPELSQYIKDLQQARNDALKNAQEGKQTGLESAANLNAKLDVIATLLEGSPIAPSLRMGDTVAKEAFIAESKKAFDDPDEGAALAEHVWNRAQEKLKVTDQAKANQIAAAEKQIRPLVDERALAIAANTILLAPEKAAEMVRTLRNSLETRGLDMNRALDVSTPEGMAFAALIDKNSTNPETARQLKLFMFAAQMRAECHETSAKLPSEQTIDRLLALSAADRKLVDSYFLGTSEKSADRYLLEAYMDIRKYRREDASTLLARQPVENREAIVSKLVLSRAASEGMEYRFRDGQAVDDGIFRKTIEKIFDTNFGARPGQHEISKAMGGIQNLDHFDYHMRIQAASTALASLSASTLELTGNGLAEHRADLLANLLPVVLSTDSKTKINLTPQFIATLESIPQAELRETAAAYQKKTGISLEQALRSYSSGPMTEATLFSLSTLLATDAQRSAELLLNSNVQEKARAVSDALQNKNATDLHTSAIALHDTLTAQGLSITRALDSSTDEGKALDTLLKGTLNDAALLRQAKASIFAVELERQAGLNSAQLPSQGVVGYYLGLAKDEKAVVQEYFKSQNQTPERFLIEAFSGASGYQPLNWESSTKRADRADAKQIIAALLISAAEQRGEPMQLKDGQLADAAAPTKEVYKLYANEADSSRADYLLKTVLPQQMQTEELSTLCRQALMVQTLQSLSAGSASEATAVTDSKNAALLAANLKHMLAADPATGGNLAAPLLSMLGELPEERRIALRDEYQKQTNRDLIADIHAGMLAHNAAQVDFITGNAAVLLGRDDFERSAGFISQSLAQTGKLTPQTFADLMRGLDADGCLKGDRTSLERLEKTIAAYEKISGSGETFEKLLQRNGIPSSLVNALRTGDRAVVDACNVYATSRGSENPIQALHQLLGGEFNLNSRPELAAAYEKTFGEKLGDIRKTVVLAATAEYRAEVEQRRKVIDTLRKSGENDQAELAKHDFNGADAAKSLIPVYGIYNAGSKFFYIWDGAYEAQAKDMARRAEDNLKLTEVYVEKASRLKEITAWTDQGSKLLEQAAELQSKGNSDEAAQLDQQATVLFMKAQCRMLDIPYPSDSFEARTGQAQTLAREHAALIKANASAAEIEKKGLEAKAAFNQLVTGPWGPHQTALVREAIKSVLEIDPSIDPRNDPKASQWTARLISNPEGTGYLDEVPARALELTKEERKQFEDLVGGVRESQERELIEQKRAQFEIESEFARNKMKPMGQRNLALLELEQRYTHRRNMAEFQKDWAAVMENFDRTEGQLKAVRTGVLVVGSMATGGAGLGYLLAITAGSHAIQGAGDVAAGNKTWSDAGKTFVYEGGKDLINVGMAGGMAQLMRGGQVANFLGQAAGKAAPGSSLFVRSVYAGRQVLVSGTSGSAFGISMEGTNLAWDAGMYHAGMSKHEVTLQEAQTRLMTAGATGFLGGSVGGGSAMLRANIAGQGFMSSVGRGAVSIAEYGIAGQSARYQVGWGADGSFGIHNQGFDVFSTVMAVGSTYVGNKAAQVHTPGSDPSQLRSFAMFQPEPGVYSTPSVKNFSLHAAELKPITDKIAPYIGLGEVKPISKAGIGTQAAELSAEIARTKTALKYGYEMVEPRAENAAPLMLGAAGAEPPPPSNPGNPAILPSPEPLPAPSGATPALPSGSERGAQNLLPSSSANNQLALAGTAPETGLANTSPATPNQGLAASHSDGATPPQGTPPNEAASSSPETAASSSTPIATEPGKTTERRYFSAEERAQLEVRLAELEAKYQEGLGKAKLDKRDGAIDAKAQEKTRALDTSESQALIDARNEKIGIEAQLKKKGSDAVTGEARQKLEDKLRVLTEKTIPVEREADILTKKYKPHSSNPEEFKLMNETIREVAKLEALGKRNGGLTDLTDQQYQRLVDGYKVLEDIKYTRKVSTDLQASRNKLDLKAERDGWTPERLSAEKAIVTEKAKLKVLDRTAAESPETDSRRSMIQDQLSAAKREATLERQVARHVKYFGAGTPEEFTAAREYLRVRDEFIKAGRTASPDLAERFNKAYQHHVAVREAAQLTVAIAEHNAKLETRLKKTELKLEKSNAMNELKTARHEEAEINTLLKSHRKEGEVVRKAHEILGEQLRTERAKTAPGAENPRIQEISAEQRRLALWEEANKGFINRGEGKYHQRTVGANERATIEYARNLLESRAAQLSSVEIPYLKEVNSHVGGKKYERFPQVVESAHKLARAEREHGSQTLMSEGLSTPEHPSVTAARSELTEAKRIARTEITRVEKLAQLGEEAAKHKWHSKLVNAKTALIECEAAVQRTKNLPRTNEQRELALANRAAAREQVEIEKTVYKLAIQKGSGSDREIKLAREVATQERRTNFDPEMGFADNPKYTDAVARLKRYQNAVEQRRRDIAHNQTVDNAIVARDRKIEARNELPELKELRKQLQRAESAYDRTGKQRVSTAADAALTERINDLKQSKIPQAERVDALARKYGYGSTTEIEAARTIAALERKLGTTNPSMDEIRLRLSPKEQSALRDAWSAYQGAQTEAKRVAYAAKIDRSTQRSLEQIDSKPWIPERKAAAREEARLVGELRKLKGASPDIEQARRTLREELSAHRNGALRDAERLDFLARTRGYGTEKEVTAAKKVVEAERSARNNENSDSARTSAKQSAEEALVQLKSERYQIKVENKYVARATRAEWKRDYSAQTLTESVLSPTTAIVVRSATALTPSDPSGTLGAADTPLDERVATFEEIFNRKLRPDEVEFLNMVPDFMYKEVVSRVQAGWTPSASTADSPVPVGALPEGRGLALPGDTGPRPVLSSGGTPERILPAAREPLYLNAADEARPLRTLPESEPALDVPAFSPREQRELAEMFASNMERSLLLGRDSRGNSIDTVQVRSNLIAQKEQIAQLLEQEIAQQRRMIELGNEAARRGELPGGIKADLDTIKATQRELFQEIESLDRAAARVREETEALRQAQPGSTRRAAQTSPTDENTGNSRHTLDEDGTGFSTNGDDDWWRNGGSAPEYRPQNGPRGGGGAAVSSRSSATLTSDRPAWAPVEGSVSVLEPTNLSRNTSSILRDTMFASPAAQEATFGAARDIAITAQQEAHPATDSRARARRPATTMNQREIDNFMLGVDDIEGSSLDAVLNHLGQAEGQTSATTRAPRWVEQPLPRSTETGTRSPGRFSEQEPVMQPQRQAAQEPLPQSRVAYAEPAPFEFKFDLVEPRTDTALAVFSPELEQHMATLSAAVDEAAPVKTVAIQPYRATTAGVVEPAVLTQPSTALEASTGQLLGRLTTSRTGTDLDLELQPETAPAKSRSRTETETLTEKKTEDRRRTGHNEHSPEEEKKHHYEHTEKERKKHIAELSRSEKKGGAKLRFTHLVDELGDEDLVIETEENSG
ncbi:MAG: hypothetical protein J0M12_07705 [Deltaproteobacteria bacterium]|nr:hypothetical protein [Deltaproteobacteria bacterium]